MYMCGHICLLVKCLPQKLADVTACVDFLSYSFMKIYATFVRSLTMLDILDTQFREERCLKVSERFVF